MGQDFGVGSVVSDVEGKEIQLENGEYTRIHNSILEVLALAKLPAGALKLLLFLLRKTYGWNKKEDAISLTQWQEGTGLTRHNVAAHLEQLVKLNVIYRTPQGQGFVYGFNKYIEQWNTAVFTKDGNRAERWKGSPKQGTGSSVGTSSKTGTRTSSKLGTGTSSRTGTHKRQLKTPKDTSAYQAVFDALMTVCKLDAALKGSQIGKTANALLKAGYLDGDVKAQGDWWYRHDFRGRKGQPPTLAQVTDTILVAKQAKDRQGAPAQEHDDPQMRRAAEIKAGRNGNQQATA
jgi:phage replication O-like protein O